MKLTVYWCLKIFQSRLKCCAIKKYSKPLAVIIFIFAVAISCSKDDNNPPPPQPPVPAPDTSLIAYYAFNGNAEDSSIYHHDGTVSNALLTTDRFGVADKAYAFNGTDSYIRLPGTTQFDQNGNISISAWVKPEIICGSGGGCYIVWRGDGQSSHDPYALYFNSFSAGIRKDVGNGNTSNQVLALLNTTYQNIWTHVAGTYDSATNTGRAYINGVMAKEEVFTSSAVSYATAGFLTNIGLATIGVSNTPFGGFKGSIDEVRIYKKVLTAEDVLKLSK